MHPIAPIHASVDDLAWLAGRWLGQDAADRLEEVWSAPHAGMMLGMFRWHRGSEPRFYELLSIEPDETGGVVFRIKHFDPGLVGWEERDEAVTLDLVELSGSEAIFLKRGEARWMVYRLEGATYLVCWFETEDSPHAPGDEFRYARG
jgi:hypothetical protein